MQLTTDTTERLKSIISGDRVVLFMKGDRTQPQCGFSATTIGILDSLVPDYTTVNVLEDQGVREGIKAYSDWPTIPQLYIDGEFVGGCDIVKQMFNAGELHEMLGVAPPDRTPPEITVTEEAVAIIRNALESNPGSAVHLSIDGRWQHGFSLGAEEGHEIKATSNGVEILFDVASAQRAKGLVIGVEQTLQGTAFKIENPNAPAPVTQMSVRELKDLLERGDAITIFDVRGPEERMRASIEGAIPLDDEGVAHLEALDRGAPIVFMCHTGQRSNAAAEHFRLQGFTDVRNLSGGIDAWSTEVDPSVPRY